MQDISIESVNNSFPPTSHITEDKSDVEFDDNITKKTEKGILISNNREKASNSCKPILKSTDDFDKEKNFYHRNDNDNNFWSKKDHKNNDNKTEKSEFQKTNQTSLLNKNYDEEFDFSDDELDEKNEIENERENLSQYNENEFQNTRRKKSSEILKEKIDKSRRDENNRYLQNHENREYGECGENHSFASDGDIEGLSDDDEMASINYSLFIINYSLFISYFLSVTFTDSFHFISFHIISFHIISFHFISFHFISFIYLFICLFVCLSVYLHLYSCENTYCSELLKFPILWIILKTIFVSTYCYILCLTFVEIILILKGEFRMKFLFFFVFQFTTFSILIFFL